MNTIKRLLIVGAAMFAAHAAHATTLLSLPINTPINTTKTTPIQTKDWPPENLTVQCNFVYGLGGATVDAYVQMSVDGGSTWVDVAEVTSPRRRCVSYMTSHLCHPLRRRVPRKVA
jgi:hypothetical protein